jgi:hypothetical protein
MYNILPYTYRQAKKLGVMIHPSTTPGKKIDVYDGKKLASIGDTAYGDYPTFLKEDGKAFADERRRLYHIRFKRISNKVGTPGYYASLLLW